MTDESKIASKHEVTIRKFEGDDTSGEPFETVLIRQYQDAEGNVIDDAEAIMTWEQEQKEKAG